ncbi:MAG: hypothetical protein UZ21_OP11001000621 [Microgenomates bacterium OLB22]|nr:MAG: hypothetical protein UZ21_OP11001000621 [Microgenomates bacterium OLB22]
MGRKSYTRTKKAILDGEYPAGTPEWIITVHLKTTQEEKLLGGIFRAKYDMTLADLEARDVNTILDQIVAEDGSRNEAPRRGRNILDSLSAIQRTVFSALYALEGMRCMTKQEVAQQLAISLEEVDRIEEEAYRIIQFGN